MSNKKIKLFLVDDDSVFLKSLELEFLQHADFEIETYSTGEMCINNLFHKPDVIILNYLLNSIYDSAMNGIEVLDKIKELYPNMPVIILSSQDKDIAISCMRHQACDYVAKGEAAFLRLQQIISSIPKTPKLKKDI